MLNRLFLIIFMTLLTIAGYANNSSANNDPALMAYHQGVEATTIGAREQATEKALQLYLAQFNRMKDENKQNGWLCYNIGNCYFTLNQLGEAIYYYRLALKLLPNDDKISSNLQVALAERENGIDVEQSKIFETLLFFHYDIASADRLSILVGSAIFTSIFLVCLIFGPNLFFRYGSGLSALVFVIILLSIGSEYYFPNHLGVVTQKTDIRRDADLGFAPISAMPFSVGSSLQVLSLKNDWYKVKLNDGRKGYVEQKKLKLLW